MSDIIEAAAAFLALFCFLFCGGYALGWAARMFTTVSDTDD